MKQPRRSLIIQPMSTLRTDNSSESREYTWSYLYYCMGLTVKWNHNKCTHFKHDHHNWHTTGLHLCMRASMDRSRARSCTFHMALSLIWRYQRLNTILHCIMLSARILAAGRRSTTQRCQEMLQSFHYSLPMPLLYACAYVCMRKVLTLNHQGTDFNIVAMGAQQKAAQPSDAPSHPPPQKPVSTACSSFDGMSFRRSTGFFVFC